MASRSPPRSSFSRCIESNALSSTCRTETCLRSRNDFQRRPGLSPSQFWAFPKLTEKSIRLLLPHVLQILRMRTQREIVGNLHCAEPTHLAADDFRSFYCDRIGRGPLFLGARSFRGRRFQRWTGWAAGAQVASTNVAGAVSRPDRRQAFIEHDASRAFHLAQDSVEVHGAGVQPRYFHL